MDFIKRTQSISHCLEVMYGGCGTRRSQASGKTVYWRERTSPRDCWEKLNKQKCTRVECKEFLVVAKGCRGESKSAFTELWGTSVSEIGKSPRTENLYRIRFGAVSWSNGFLHLLVNQNPWAFSPSEMPLSRARAPWIAAVALFYFKKSDKCMTEKNACRSFSVMLPLGTMFLEKSRKSNIRLPDGVCFALFSVDAGCLWVIEYLHSSWYFLHSFQYSGAELGSLMTFFDHGFHLLMSLITN